MLPKPSIIDFTKTTLIGMCMPINFEHHNPSILWSTFMPRLKEITHTVSADLYSIEIYPDGFFENFSFQNMFSKCAGIAVSSVNSIPDKMEEIIIPEGLYARFTFKGGNELAKAFYSEIFESWLPNSQYMLDNRPHFSVMGAKYMRNNLESEEDIFIPIK